jgi:AAA family ATP:ADP antiporter
MLKKLFKKTFDIRDGEIRISFFMQLYVFLLITVLLMVKPTVNALFLSKLGATQLPYAFVLTALIAVATSYFYNKAIKKYSLRNIATGTLVFFGICFVLLSVLMHFKALPNWVLYAYYLSVALFAVLVTSQFWIIANMVYNAREAKRLFGFIGAGAIAGGIFGGYLTSIIAPTFGNKIVILVAAFFILCCIPILFTVWKLRIVKLNSFIRSQRKESKHNSYSSPFRLIISSKHLTYLAAIVAVGVIMAKLVDYQFSDFANRAIPDSDDLASFFGFWFSTFNVAALLIQLFVTNRLLAWLGVTSNLLILPFGIALGCLLFLTFPELWVLIIIKGLDGSFKQSINKAGIELSILPIPAQIKNEAKSYIDVVVDSIATGVAGLLLLFVIKKLELSTTYITVIILLFLFIWMLLIYKLREAYFDSFRSNIRGALLASEMSNNENKSTNSTKNAIQIFSSGDEDSIILMLDRLKDTRLQSLKPYIVNLLDHPSNKVKATAIAQLVNYKEGTALEKVKELIRVQDDEVVFQVLDYLLHNSDIDDSEIFTSYLDHPSDYINNAALLCLARENTQNPTFNETFNLHQRIADKIKKYTYDTEELRKEEIAELLITIGYSGEPRFYSYISAHFYNTAPFVIHHALRAAGLTAHEPFVKDLLHFLSIKEYRKTARRALRKYGPSMASTLLKMEETDQLKMITKRYIPRVIESYKNRESLKILTRLLRSNDIVSRLQAARSLSRIHENGTRIPIDTRSWSKLLLRESVFYRKSISAIITIRQKIQATSDVGLDSTTWLDSDTELLIARESLLEVLENQVDQGLETIFKLLSLRYDQADIETTYYGLKSANKETKINALEFLDNLLKAKFKSTLLPLIEYQVLEPTEYTANDSVLKQQSEKSLLKDLLKTRSVRVKLAVLMIMQYSNEQSYRNVISKLLKHRNNKVRLFAKNALDELELAKVGQLLV